MKPCLRIIGLMLLAILIVSCDIKDLVSPDLTYKAYYCRYDAQRNKTLLLRPEDGILSYSDSQIHRTKDGKVLIYRDYFWKGEPDFTGFYPISGYIPTNYTTHIPYFSEDGRYLWFAMSGSIYRFDLNNSSYEKITSDLGFAVHSPRLTADGNYLVMIRSLSGTINPGYPVVMNLNDSTLVHLDNAEPTATQAVYIPKFGTVYYVRYNETNYYQGEGALYSISINNAFNQALVPIVWYYNLNLYLSNDERFIVTHKPPQGFLENGHLLVRDNSSMLWSEICGTGQAALARTANVLYYTKDTRIYRWDLETGTRERIISDTFKGKKIKGFYSLSPSWDGTDLIFTAELGD